MSSLTLAPRWMRACVYVVCWWLAAGLDDDGYVPWGLMHTCKFRRSVDSSICCSDLHCPKAACCHLYFVYGGYSAQGQCVPRHPNTKLCSRRRQCLSQRDCYSDECCRLTWKGHHSGECQRLGAQGDVCTRKPVYVDGLQVLCPCQSDYTCDGGQYNVKGYCQLPRPPPRTTTTTTTTTTTPKPTTTTTPKPTTTTTTTTTPKPATTTPTTTTTTTTPKPTTTTTTTTTPKPTTTTPTTTTTTTTPPPPPTTTTTTTTENPTTKDPCSECPDPVFFCCLNNMCRIRPSFGDPCGSNTCECRDSVCSDPDSPDNNGKCQ